ncbi:MAG: hypothetical protein QM741_16550 [Rudaea sp.]|uniref:hypothetical protein n=1 Tax=Rudaea sp. TaxID=2136325 RepID=UPI0039E62FAC
MMRRTRGIGIDIGVLFGAAIGTALAQTPPASEPKSPQATLPDVKVVGPKWETRRGGYVISSDFNVDPKMSAVIFPAEPFQKGDIFDFRTVRMSDDEYFVLQECASADCTQAHVLQVWTRNGALGLTSRDPNRFWIPHEGKMFMFMQRFPMSGGGMEGGSTFSGYEPSSPPLVLNPTGTPDQFRVCDVKAAQEKGPVKVVESSHDGSQMKLSFEGGASVFIQRMRAAE